MTTDTRLLKFLRNKEDVRQDEAIGGKQCPKCGYFLAEEALAELEYQVDGILDCPKCGETVEE